MQTADDRLAFLVRFAQLDLGKCHPPDLILLRKNLTAFVGRGPGPMHPTKRQGWMITGTPKPKPEWQESLTDEDLQELQNEVMQILKELLEKEPPKAGIPITATTPRDVSLQLWNPGNERALFINGALRDVVLVILHLLLVMHGFDKVRACPALKPRQQEPCGRLFVRIRKQQYCSSQCKERTRKQKA